MNITALQRWGIFPLWALLVCSLFFRNPIPIDETRYLSVAWEMWLRQDFLVPYLNGQPYSHKPPLLFWLFQTGWSVFGVNEWWPRLVGPLCALINLLLTRKLAQKLWPDQPAVSLLVPWILISCLLWTLFATTTMFDMLLSGCVLLAMLGLITVDRGESLRGWIYFSLAIGLGALTKGPVILVHTLPIALSVAFWSQQSKRKNMAWFSSCLVATLVGALIALAWALPAAYAGGEEYKNAILWHQTVDRTVATKIHTRPFWWYLPLVPLCFFPWIFWPRLWQSIKGSRLFSDAGLRFCVLWLMFTFVIFSIIGSKQIHYLIPIIPAFSLIVARLTAMNQEPKSMLVEYLIPTLFLITGIFLIFIAKIPGLAKLHWVQAVEPLWGISIILIALMLFIQANYQRRLSAYIISTAMIVSIFIGLILFFKYTGLAYNLRPAAMKIKTFQDNDLPVVYVGKYEGEFHFLGRLTQPIQVISYNEASNWAVQHPTGFLVTQEKAKPDHVFYSQLQREKWLVFRSSAEFSH